MIHFRKQLHSQPTTLIPAAAAAAAAATTAAAASASDVPLGEINSIIQENVHQLVIKLDCEVNVKVHETTLLM